MLGPDTSQKSFLIGVASGKQHLCDGDSLAVMENEMHMAHFPESTCYYHFLSGSCVHMKLQADRTV